MLTSIEAGAGLPARGWIFMTMFPLRGSVPLLLDPIGLIRLDQAGEHRDLAADHGAALGIAHPPGRVEAPDLLDFGNDVRPSRQRLGHRLEMMMLRQPRAVVAED